MFWSCYGLLSSAHCFAVAFSLWLFWTRRRPSWDSSRTRSRRSNPPTRPRRRRRRRATPPTEQSLSRTGATKTKASTTSPRRRAAAATPTAPPRSPPPPPPPGAGGGARGRGSEWPGRSKAKPTDGPEWPSFHFISFPRVSWSCSGTFVKMIFTCFVLC